MRNLVITAVLFVLIGYSQLYAQTGIKKHSADIEHHLVHFDDILEYERVNGIDTVRIKARLLKDRDEESHASRFDHNGNSVIHYDPFGKINNSSLNSTKAPSQMPALVFEALEDDNTYIPPDVQGAVGPNHIMEAYNTEYRIQSRTGADISTVSIFSFYSTFGTTILPFDPRITYDHNHGRWIIVCAADDNLSTSSILIAVSQTSNPTGSWNFWRIFVDNTNTNWIDYPILGLNKDWLVVSGTMLSIGTTPAFSHVQIHVINKHHLYSGTTTPMMQKITSSSYGETMAPVFSYNSGLKNMFLFQNKDGNQAGSGVMRLMKLSGTLPNVSLSQVSLFSTPNPWAYVPPTTDFAPQLSSTNKISLNDARVLDAVYRDGSIYAVHHIFLPATNPQRSAVQWWQIDTNGVIIQRGRIDDPNNSVFYGFPSVAVNAKDDILIGFSTFSSTQYPSAAYAYREACDTINTIRTPYQYANGTNSYYKNYGINTNRWGDFTATVLDTNQMDFWTLQQVSDTPSTTGVWTDRWTTFWAKVIPVCNVPLMPTFSYQPPIHCSGSVETYKVNIDCGVDTLNWIATGVGWGVVQSAGDSAQISAGSWPGAIYAVAGNSCGTSPNAVINVTPALLPPPPAGINLPNEPLCEGKTLAFSVPPDPSINSYTWVISGNGWSGSSSSDTCWITIGSGMGSIDVYSNNICGQSPVSSHLDVPPVPKPLASFSLLPDTFWVFYDLSVCYTGNPILHDSLLFWNWDGGVINSLDTSTSCYNVAWSSVGPKVISVYANDGICQSDVYLDTVFMTPKIGVTEHNTNEISINPQPANGEFYIKMSKKYAGAEAELYIYSSDAKQVKKDRFTLAADATSQVKIPDLPSGTYFYRLVINDELFNGEIINIAPN